LQESAFRENTVMGSPRFHSCTWSDQEEAEVDDERSELYRPLGNSPASLVDKELRLWATYPEERQGKRKGKRAKARGKASKLWAVIIIEALRQMGAFTYEVTLRRIFKRDDRLIKVWVSNDPRDQSEGATVFGYVSPSVRLLTPLEQYLSQVVAMRIYEAITKTWPRGDLSGKTDVIEPSPPWPQGIAGGTNATVSQAVGVEGRYV
jgi:hypothetical protein